MDLRDYVPVGKAEAAALAAAQAAGTPPPASSTAAAPVAPVAPSTSERPLFVGEAVRSRPFPLEHHVVYRSRTYTVVVLRRPGAKEVGRFFEALVSETAINPDAVLYFPVFVDEDGETIPAEVLDTLDDDDRTPIMERVVDFLPRRLLALRGGGDRASPPASGASTAPTSST